jgi:hypothetical protein
VVRLLVLVAEDVAVLPAVVLADVLVLAREADGLELDPVTRLQNFSNQRNSMTWNRVSETSPWSSERRMTLAGARLAAAPGFGARRSPRPAHRSSALAAALTSDALSSVAAADQGTSRSQQAQ